MENKKEQNTMNKRTRNGLLYGIIGLLLVAAIIGGIYSYKSIQMKEQQLSELNGNNRELIQDVNHRDSVINDMIKTFDRIESDLEIIKKKRDLLNVKSDNPEFTEDKRESIVKDIQMLNTMLDENRKKIASLNSQLRNSGIKLSELQKKIDGLQTTIDERDADIALLKDALQEKDFEMAQLNIKLDTLQTEVIRKDNIIRQQEDNLNRAYYTYGTYKDLKEKGLLTKEGGFLFIGQNTTIQEDLNAEHFTEIDISRTKTLPINGKKAELITDHPKSSYRFVEDEEQDQIAFIEIENPDEFWKISKYVVVEVK